MIAFLTGIVGLLLGFGAGFLYRKSVAASNAMMASHGGLRCAAGGVCAICGEASAVQRRKGGPNSC